MGWTMTGRGQGLVNPSASAPASTTRQDLLLGPGGPKDSFGRNSEEDSRAGDAVQNTIKNAKNEVAEIDKKIAEANKWKGTSQYDQAAVNALTARRHDISVNTLQYAIDSLGKGFIVRGVQNGERRMTPALQMYLETQQKINSDPAMKAAYDKYVAANGEYDLTTFDITDPNGQQGLADWESKFNAYWSTDPSNPNSQAAQDAVKQAADKKTATDTAINAINTNATTLADQAKTQMAKTVADNQQSNELAFNQANSAVNSGNFGNGAVQQASQTGAGVAEARSVATDKDIQDTKNKIQDIFTASDAAGQENAIKAMGIDLSQDAASVGQQLTALADAVKKSIGEAQWRDTSKGVDLEGEINKIQQQLKQGQIDKNNIFNIVKLVGGALMVGVGAVLTATGAGAAVGVPLMAGGIGIAASAR